MNGVFCMAFQGDCGHVINCVFAWWTSVSHGVVSTGFRVKSSPTELSLNQGKITTVARQYSNHLYRGGQKVLVDFLQSQKLRFPRVSLEMLLN